MENTFVNEQAALCSMDMLVQDIEIVLKFFHFEFKLCVVDKRFITFR